MYIILLSAWSKYLASSCLCILLNVFFYYIFLSLFHEYSFLSFTLYCCCNYANSPQCGINKGFHSALKVPQSRCIKARLSLLIHKPQVISLPLADLQLVNFQADFKSSHLIFSYILIPRGITLIPDFQPAIKRKHKSNVAKTSFASRKTRPKFWCCDIFWQG